MGLIINQGIQDTSADISYDIIVENDVLVRLTDISLHEKFENTLELEFTIIRGKYAQRKVWDTAPFDPHSEFGWKYRNYRKAAGCPYQEGEPTSIDIEALLLNKPFVLNLGIRKANNGKEYQQVTLSKTPAANLLNAQPQRQGFGMPAQPAQTNFTQPVQNNFAQPMNTGWGAPAPGPQAQPVAQPQQWGAPAPQHALQPAQPQEQWGNNETLDIASDDLPF